MYFFLHFSAFFACKKQQFREILIQGLFYAHLILSSITGIISYLMNVAGLFKS